MEIVERYIKEIEEDLKIDEFNIKESSLKTPGRKHFWVSRLINHKRNLYFLEQELESTSKKLVTETREKSPVSISSITLQNAVAESDTIKALVLKIKEEKFIIELLEKTEKTFSSLTYDIKNIIAIMQLEQM
jgi:hypothetical protein